MLDPKIYEAIGRVSVAATTLQHSAAGAAALGIGEGDDWVQRTLSKPGTHVQDALRSLAETVGPGDLQDRLSWYANRMTELLVERNDVMHSVTVLASDGQTVTPMMWQPRSDQEKPIDVAQLLDLENSLQVHAVHGVELQHVTLAWWKSQRIRGANHWRTKPRDEETGETKN